MSTEYIVNKAELEMIADKLREKKGTTEKIPFPLGFTEHIDDVYEAGKQAESKEFWKDYFPIDIDEQGWYPCLFAGGCWNAETFSKVVYPKDKITPLGTGGAERMFYYFNRNRRITDNPNKPVDLTEFCNHADFSKCTKAEYTFVNARVININLDLSSCTTLNNTFGNHNGGYIDNLTIKVTEACTSFTNIFAFCYYLKYFRFAEGSVIAASLSFSHSRELSHDSIVSVINALSSVTSGLSVTFSKTAVNKAFETSAGANDGSTSAEWLALVATKINWTISLV